jgi:hypothetical protein
MGCIATSTLKRACDSAKLLAPGRPLLCDPVFAEAEIPSDIPLGLSLAPRHWSLLARVAMNRLISRALRTSGWRGAASGFAFWSAVALQREGVSADDASAFG